MRDGPVPPVAGAGGALGGDGGAGAGGAAAEGSRLSEEAAPEGGGRRDVGPGGARRERGSRVAAVVGGGGGGRFRALRPPVEGCQPAGRGGDVCGDSGMEGLVYFWKSWGPSSRLQNHEFVLGFFIFFLVFAPYLYLGLFFSAV